MSEENLKSLLQGLGRALNSAMTDAEVADSLDHLRKEGYAVFLMLDRDRMDRARRVLPLTPDTLPRKPQEPVRQGAASEPPSRRSGGRTPEPEFQINARDLAFLQSIGIDPTRRIRRRRRR